MMILNGDGSDVWLVCSASWESPSWSCPRLGCRPAGQIEEHNVYGRRNPIGQREGYQLSIDWENAQGFLGSLLIKESHLTNEITTWVAKETVCVSRVLHYD